jgi:maltooligosyltrehalose trehalohydrolase
MTVTAFGPRLDPNGTLFRLWAPAAQQVALRLHGVKHGPYPMTRKPDGWFETRVGDVGPGARYGFRIDDELDVPDPASRFQPDGVHGPSQIVDHRFSWQAAGWRGRPWHEAVFLEIHVGTFTPTGTFRATIDKLDEIVATGFTAIELMPVAEFAGRWNWGYDGALLFAPAHVYGSCDDLKALIDAAHQRGLMVFLDVVYNHFGPEGNYLGRYAPQFFTEASTPWGSAIDYERAEVRAFAIGSALQWLRDYRFDGLRLDAVHAIVEPGRSLLLQQLSKAAGELASAERRHIHLVVENYDNTADLLDPITDPPRGKYRAQWNDDYHHAWHVMLTDERSAHYRDYQESPGRLIARALADGFIYQGEHSLFREANRGTASAHLPPTAFVNFLQNHDQIGNRAQGDRLTRLASPRALAAALTVTLLSPAPPLMFMGDAWAAHEPFPFFCDFKGELAQAVRQGRKAEFAEAYRDHPQDVPDALEAATRERATLDWTAQHRSPHQEHLTLVRQLLHKRRDAIVPLLPLIGANAGAAQFDDGHLRARWRLRDGRTFSLSANLSDQELVSPPGDGVMIWGTASDRLTPWDVRVMLQS